MIRFDDTTVLCITFALVIISQTSVLFSDAPENVLVQGDRTPQVKAKQEDDKQVDEIRILSYNIHAGKGLDGKIDLPRIAAVIKSANPHLVALQEVDVKTRRSGKIDQAKKLAQLCGMTSYFGKAIDYQGGEYGNAILCSKKIIASNSTLVSTAGAERRVATGAAIQIGKDEVVTLISTHFDHKSQKARTNAAKKIAQIVSQSDGVVLVAGDFNCSLGSKELAPLERVCASPSKQPVFTFPAAQPTKQIDFILVDQRTTWKLKKLEALNAHGASDHRPLLAVFKVD